MVCAQRLSLSPAVAGLRAFLLARFEVYVSGDVGPTGQAISFACANR
jgi:hypothetical protein